MSGTGKEILLVGSVPLESAEEVLRTCSEKIGGYVSALPDGEVGERSIWVVCQAYRVFHEHPQIETLQRPEGWAPSGYAEDMWSFRVRPDAGEVRFDDLRYATWAEASYATFRRLKDAGTIPAEVRFQVSLPTPGGGVSFFFHDPRELAKVYAPYQDAMLREVEKIARAIPPKELAIQWDVCWEVLELAGAELPWALPDPWPRFVDTLKALGPSVPPEARLGYHLCYADLGHQHYVQPKDLGICVRMANAIVEHSGRPVDWVHMPVPRDRDDDAYFAPLKDLAAGSTRIYLGLLHFTDGEEGARRRLATARRHLANFGLATECGFGRRAPETLPGLLDLHRTIASEMGETR
jgi:hypothetical protein